MGGASSFQRVGVLVDASADGTAVSKWQEPRQHSRRLQDDSVMVCMNSVIPVAMERMIEDRATSIVVCYWV